MTPISAQRPIALVTGASRKIGIGAAIALALAESGWDVATTFWRPYDATMPWGSESTEPGVILDQVRSFSPGAISIEADLSDTVSPTRISTETVVFDFVEQELGPVTALVMAHCQSVDSDIQTTSLESFDLHFAVNARATWLLIREFGRRYRGGHGNGRIISITSDHTAGNLPYGASKGAMDRIVLAAAHEFKDLGVTANVINPGATDTGWMPPELMALVQRTTPLARVGLPLDCANLVKFLCSKDGGWINAQLLYSNGGTR
jgi:3-oxoacyl-[acyl-carrier protein] reductase